LLIPTSRAYGEFPSYTEELSPNPVAKGGRFTHTIILDLEDTDKVSLDVSTLPEGIRLYRGPSIVPIWVQLESGRYIRKVRIRTTFSVSQYGKIVFGGFPLRLEDDVSVTDFHLVRVGYWSNRKIVIPYEPEWVIPDKEVYTGQAVPVVLTVRNMEEVSLFDRVTVDQPAGAMFESIAGIGSIESRTRGNITLYDIPVSGYMLTPSRPGTLVLPRAVVEAGEVSGTSSSAPMDILPLPEEVSSTGAVGSFTYSSQLNEESTVEGRELELKITISGTGNLNFLEVPDPSVEGLTLLSKNDEGAFTPEENGYTGYREIKYLYLPEKAGEVDVRTPDFQFLDPETGRVIQISGRRFNIAVNPAPVAAVAESESEKCPFEPFNPGRKRFLSGTLFYSQPLFFLSLLPGPLFLLVVLLIRKKPVRFFSGLFIIFLLSGCSYEEEFRNNLEEAIELYQNGAYSQAKDSFELILEGEASDPAVAYNYALCCYQNGDTVQALQAARNAVYRAPLFLRGRNLLGWIEDQHEGLGGSVSVPLVHPDLFFLILVLGVNGAALCTVLRIWKKRGLYAILAILLVSLSVPAGLFLWYSRVERNNPDCIVYQEDIYLTKIPSESATPWVSFPAGTAVKVLQEASGYYLVKDGRGVEGWIQADALVRDSELIFLLDDSNRIQ